MEKRLVKFSFQRLEKKVNQSSPVPELLGQDLSAEGTDMQTLKSCVQVSCNKCAPYWLCYRNSTHFHKFMTSHQQVQKLLPQCSQYILSSHQESPSPQWQKTSRLLLAFSAWLELRTWQSISDRLSRRISHLNKPVSVGSLDTFILY